jgi:hypothetical protein
LCIIWLASFTLTSIRQVQQTLDGQEENSDLGFFGEPLLDILNHLEERDSRMVPQTQKRQDDLACLVHASFTINASDKRVSDPTVKILKQETGVCGKLKRQWRHNSPLSRYAKLIAAHQSNCTLRVATNQMDNIYGMGSHLMLWSQAMCNSMQAGFRVRTHQPEWLWMDQQYCDLQQAQKSPLLCYFPSSEYHCNLDELPAMNVSDPRDMKKRCKLARDPTKLVEFRAASTEYLFHRISPLVIKESQRQIGLLFGSQGVPDDIITVHIRWGDKFWEMDLPKIEEYISAIQTLNQNASTANIYLATEDPKALDEFIKAKPIGWKVYHDVTIRELNAFRPKKGNRASWATRNTKGRAGLVALGSLLVSLEANYFVLTTKSNWSKLMDQIRTNIVDPRCRNCTRMIDLRPGVW